MKYILALISILLGSLAQYLLKLGMNRLSENNDSTFDILRSCMTNIPLWGGLTCYGLSMFFWLFVLSQMELSKAYPLVSIGYVFTLFLGYFLLGEQITNYKTGGISLIIIGVILISKG
jgi:multidrug transporter EmrE-like cation transporter